MKENKIVGVYKITNIITGEFYIGSSKNIKHRWTGHRSPSTWARRPGMKLYQAFIKYGLDNFKFEIIEETDNLKEKEQYYIEQLKPTYNNRWADGQDTERYKKYQKTYRKIHSKELLAKTKAYYQTEEHSEKMKAYYQAHHNEQLARSKAYYNVLCLYEGETLTLGALSKRFSNKGIPHPTQEAKKYLIS